METMVPFAAFAIAGMSFRGKIDCAMATLANRGIANRMLVSGTPVANVDCVFVKNRLTAAPGLEENARFMPVAREPHKDRCP